MSHIPKIVVINGNGIGQYCDVVRIPRKGETAIPQNLRYAQDSGKGVNCAIVIGRLGGDVSYIGKVGNDEGGVLNEKWLQDAGVHTEHFWLQDSIKTSLGLVLLAENGENLIFNFDSPGSDITSEEATEHLKQLQGAEYLITGFEIPVDVALECARLGKKMGIKVFLNSSPIEKDTVLPKLPFVDTLCINETETLILLDRAEQEINDWVGAAKELSEKYEVPTVIITLGGNGACAWSPEGALQIPGIPVKMVDESGAGDAFLAVTVQNLAWNKSLKESMEYANKYCAWVVQKTGSNGVIGKYLTLGEMDEALKRFA